MEEVFMHVKSFSLSSFSISIDLAAQQQPYEMTAQTAAWYWQSEQNIYSTSAESVTSNKHAEKNTDHT